MILIEETAVPQAALPVEQFKAHLRLGTGFSDDDVQDAVLESFLRAALATIEARTGKILIEREFSWELTRWRGVTEQALPVAPVVLVLGLAIRNRMDDVTLIDPASYRLVPDSQRPMLRAMGTSLPTIPRGGTADIRFIAGFGADWGALPADLGQAVLLLAAHFYENRSETAMAEGNIPFGVSSLIERYRTVRILGGRGR
ncbi:head-tail connector protein [Roseovarius sp. SCSIO 43702]|uniref:head-tail connector protein n=1 Tax=Roseovarius sp. SCSIO 43702 TaxID=2823043 RepID=UPI001C73D84D|nr:head-tail connector protein [Roseovarius sp. SCSIO 43702]QYX56702.1 head-tail connector protein [Roseovarius sp. SCSIO 43702]